MTALTDERLRECPLCLWEGDPGRCHWCDAELTGRRRRWCSQDCSLGWARQHDWGMARDYAVRNSPACARCGSTPDGLTLDTRLEVNHLEPILGRHGQQGCHHHQEGLEVLCHRCHVQTTAQQFGYRTATSPQQEALL